jgi:prophage DNA circulation protein
MTTVYEQASFRGASFLVESNSDEGGPRSIIHEFPGRKDVYAEPSGAFPRRFSLEAHLIGAGFEQQLLQLEKALDQGGPGKLIHPHRGAKIVVVDGPYRVQRHTRELGMVRLSITFCETDPSAAVPTVRLDTAVDVKAKVAIAHSFNGARTFSVKGPDFLTRAATAILAGPKGAITALSKINNKIHSAFGLVDDVSRTITSLTTEVVTLLNSPQDLALRFLNLVNAVLGAATAAGVDLSRGDKQRNRARVEAVLGYMTTLGNFGDTLPAVPSTTRTRAQQAATQAALVDMIEVTGLLAAVNVLVDIPFDNTDQGGSAFDLIRDVFDRVADRGTLDDATSQALSDVRAAFHKHLRETVAELPGLGHYTPPVTVPALVLAYQLYGDSTRDEELLERNPSIEHPGFLPGGVELTVAEV